MPSTVNPHLSYEVSTGRVWDGEAIAGAGEVSHPKVRVREVSDELLVRQERGSPSGQTTTSKAHTQNQNGVQSI